MAASNHDPYAGQDGGTLSPSKAFVTAVAADTDLPVIPKRIIVNVTTAGGSVVLTDVNLAESTLTLPLGVWELNLRPRRIKTATNATVVLCY